jgi:hypothetical protein
LNAWSSSVHKCMYAILMQEIVLPKM